MLYFKVSFTLSIGIDFEAVMTKETIAYTFEDIHKDTISVTGPVLDSLHVPFTVNRSFVNYYWGFTNFQYNYEGNKYNFFIKATTLGISWMGGASRPCINYSFYFGISENKFGIRIGGEFKGNYGNPDPYFNLFITKSFDFSKFGDLMKP